MKYWKNGFYDEPQESSVEITEEQKRISNIGRTSVFT